MKRYRKSKKNSLTVLAVLLVAVLAVAAGRLLPESGARDAAAPASSAGGERLLTVYFLDVGQGDSELIDLPDGRTMLIDAGNPENGPQIVDTLSSLGIRKIDTLIATHPHSDHIGGMAKVVRSVPVGQVYMPKATTNTQTFDDLLDAFQEKGLGIHTAKAGVTLYDGDGYRAAMLAPVGDKYGDLNQYSAVVRLTYGETSFLFMGDAGAESERQITADVKADVLKVGHHGSNTATTEDFLKRVSPAYAVIEVGKDNPYGHPAEATLRKLSGVGAKIYRTDEDGTVKMISDGKEIKAETQKVAASSLRPAA